jgi:hypothetical protein
MNPPVRFDNSNGIMFNAIARDQKKDFCAPQFRGFPPFAS